MRKLLLLMLAVTCLGMQPADAATYDYRFHASDVPLTECGAAP